MENNKNISSNIEQGDNQTAAFKQFFVEDAFSKPANIVGADGRSIAIMKLEGLYLTPGFMALGGWLSREMNLCLELDGKAITGLETARFCRPDVNKFLKTDSNIKHGFACIAETNSFQNIRLILYDKISRAIIFTNLNKNKSSEISEETRIILGEDIYQKFAKKLRASETAEPRLNGFIDFAISYQNENGNSATLISGWLHNPASLPLWLEDSSGERYFFENVYNFPRPDVVNAIGQDTTGKGHGFAAWINAGFPDSEKLALCARSKNHDRKIVSASIKSCNSDFNKFLKEIFSIPLPWTSLSEAYDAVYSGFLHELTQDQVNQHSALTYNEFSIGEPPTSPEVSIIIPLYGNFKFLAAQLMAFSEDCELLLNSEIIYVLDDPALFEGFRNRIDELYHLFRVPVRWVWGGVNRGFGGANNLGAKIARGKYLIFINSDVFPVKAGWSKNLLTRLKTIPRAGMAGCRLLRCDGSLQHVGMRFLYRDALGIWTNVHPLSGCAPELDAASGPVNVPAVTGACVAMSREDFDLVGGWSLDYPIGDFEDSDLCLKVRQAGKLVIYDPQTSLVHLERQTFKDLGGNEYRQRLTIYNAVMHQRKWRRLLEQPFQSSQTGQL